MSGLCQLCLFHVPSIEYWYVNERLNEGQKKNHVVQTVALEYERIKFLLTACS